LFYYLEGKTAVIEPNLAVIDCGGVGYAVNTTANTISRLKIGENTRLYTYVYIREDAFDIYGFASLSEKPALKCSWATPVWGQGGVSFLSSHAENLAMAIVAGEQGPHGPPGSQE
jgi:Holliday junction DNA helicase RuvA